jgi:hypothetical protein
VTKYVAKGMPVREDGALDWDAATEFRNSCVVPEKSGSFASRQNLKPARNAERLPVAEAPTPAPLAPAAPAAESGRRDYFSLLPAEGTQAHASLQLETLKVREKQIKLDREEGRLVELAPLNAYVAGMIMTAREELMHIPTELRDDLAQQTDPLECERMVATRIRQVLARMSEYRLAA